ncbi:STAS domain-containing protein [bacterium]|jgi:anti-sigma B factor antagonist|nr:STAS domain-containing protein [bacterium]
MSLDFKIHITTNEIIPIVHVNGEIDVYTSNELNQSIANVGEQNPNIILDLTNVHFIDSTGLGVIAFNAEKCRRAGSALCVICDKPQIRKVFDASGLSGKSVLVVEEETEAISAIQTRGGSNDNN